MQEIDEFQQTLDTVKGHGEQLKAGSSEQPGLCKQVDEKVASLEDSYLALQATAMQIKVSNYLLPYSKMAYCLKHLFDGIYYTLYIWFTYAHKFTLMLRE